MKIKHWTLLGLSLGFLSCSSSQPVSNENNSISLTQSSGLQCLQNGNLNCAQENFCALSSSDASNVAAALRCCASLSLNIAFSENTQSLGKLLGYSPEAYATIKSGTLQSAIAGKKIVFGELVFLSESQAPRLQELVIQWGSRLTQDRRSTRELNEKFKKLGGDLESLSQCLAKIPASFTEDELESDFFSSPESVKVTARDLDFLRFASAGLAYLLQSSFDYEWGFENFPSFPLEASFYEDVNGKLGNQDLKFGNLSGEAALRIVAKAPLLERSLQAFESFLQQPKAGLIDSWLRWRFNSTDLVSDTAILRSAAASMQSGLWMSVPGEAFILNASSLKSLESLPNANLIPAHLELVRQDAEGEPELNSDYLKYLFMNFIYWPNS